MVTNPVRLPDRSAKEGLSLQSSPALLLGGEARNLSCLTWPLKGWDPRIRVALTNAALGLENFFPLLRKPLSWPLGKVQQ